MISLASFLLTSGISRKVGWTPWTATASSSRFSHNYGGLVAFDKNQVNSRKIVIFHKFQRKYRFSWKNLNFSWFLTYVNFSLGAKFNRFFIILGGGRQKDQKSQFLVVLGVPYTGIWPKKSRKTLMRYQGFCEFFSVFFAPYIRGFWSKTLFLG